MSVNEPTVCSNTRLATLALALQRTLANSLPINDSEFSGEGEPRIAEEVQEDSGGLLRRHGDEPKQHDPCGRRNPVLESQHPEVSVERDQHAPFRPGPREHLSIERSRHDLGCGEHFMTGRAQGLNARKRDVLVSEQPH